MISAIRLRTSYESNVSAQTHGKVRSLPPAKDAIAGLYPRCFPGSNNSDTSDDNGVENPKLADP